MSGMGRAHDRWRRQRRKHDDIENAVDDLAWGAGNLNRSLEPRGCAVAALGLLGGLATFIATVGHVLAGWLV